MGSLSIWHWIIVIAVVLLLFGRGKISELMGDVAGGIKAFKKGMAEDDDAKPAPGAPVKTIDNTAGADEDARRDGEPRRRFDRLIAAPAAQRLSIPRGALAARLGALWNSGDA